MPACPARLAGVWLAWWWDLDDMLLIDGSCSASLVRWVDLVLPVLAIPAAIEPRQYATILLPVITVGYRG